MTNNKHLHDNFEVNFSLKGFTSILIGVYFFLLSYAYKYILESFLIDDNTLGMLSPQIIEIIFISLAAIFVLFSSLALFFSAKRITKSFKTLLWNGKTKVAFLKYLVGIIVIFAVLITLMSLGFIDFMTPTFLIMYAFFLLVFKNKARNNILILSGLSILLGIYCFIIPSYWYSSFTILAIAHATYGVVER
ncbi:MAG: hypothetical protein ACI9JT_001881 [Polaribacter sp.]|jgi:hypothetical protein